MSTAIHDCRETAGESQSPDTVLAPEEVAAAPGRFRDIVFSFSLANLCFLMVWQMAIGLAANEGMKYFEMSPPSFGFVAALLADISVLASFVYLLLQMRRSPKWRTLSSVFLSAICCFALLEMQQMLQQQFESFTLPINILTAIAVLSALLSIRRARGATKALVMLLFPLLPLLTLDAAWLYSRPELTHLRTERVAGKLASVSSHRRLVWIIFDELDYHLAFEARPPRLQMPEFDRLRNVSVSADHAQSPAWYTILSLPALLTGRRVVAEKHRTDDISLRFAETPHEWDDLSVQPNIFRRARAAGFNTAIDGWHHPYCRVIGNDLSDCATAPNGNEVLGFYDAVAEWPFFRRAAAIALWEAESLPVERTAFGNSSTFLRFHAPRSSTRSSSRSEPSSDASLLSYANIRNRAVREQQISAAKLITENAVRMAHDPDLNFILIHAPAPHLPGIWNNRTKQFAATGPSDYADNLGFTDFALGQIRRALEAAGDWDRTTVLVSADHPFRLSVWQTTSLWTPELAAITQGRQSQYVPFILKLPGQTQPLAYHRSFNTVVTGDLIWEILNGNIGKPDQAARWLDAH